MSPIPPNLAGSASRSRSESLGAGFPLRAGNSFNSFVLIISSSSCSSVPCLGDLLGLVDSILGAMAYMGIANGPH